MLNISTVFKNTLYHNLLFNSIFMMIFYANLNNIKNYFIFFLKKQKILSLYIDKIINFL
ncbi:hypothetical protein HMPREF1871_00140 [Gemelliphila asaccharolytica]|uniref:Uncharacterized protein n=1 Tax=Gemelliphila asaccharolytica TaxID=502393 RepID=A0ABR5TNB6_9BACL|nr:hypothetical protein HMPREF1871_00140 [Gemella asaccharolytica]